MPKSRVSTTMPICAEHTLDERADAEEQVGDRRAPRPARDGSPTSAVTSPLCCGSRAAPSSPARRARRSAASPAERSTGRAGRSLGAALATVGAALEEHVERGQEEQQPARDPEGRDRDADRGQQPLAEEPEEREECTKATSDRAPPDPRPLLRRSCPRVSAMKSGASPIGSMMTKSVTKAVTRAASSAASRLDAPAGGLEPLERRHPQRLGTGEAVLDLGALLLQPLDRLGVAAGVESAGWRAASRSPRASPRAWRRAPRTSRPRPGAAPPRRGAAARGFGRSSFGVGAQRRAVALGEQQPPVGVHVVVERPHPAVLDQPQPVGDELDEVRVVADEDHRAAVLGQRLDQRVAALDVEVVGRLVEDDQVRRVERRRGAALSRVFCPPDSRPTSVVAMSAPMPPRREPAAAACPAPRPAAGAARCWSGVSSSSSSSTWCWAK